MDPLILLPDDSKASILSEKLEEKIGQRSFFYLLFESKDESQLENAVEYSISELKKNSDIEDIVYHYPVEFIRKYRYLLIPSMFLNMIEELFIQWESEINPMGDNLLEEFEEPKTSEKKRYLKNRIKSVMKQFGELEYYFKGTDNNSIGIVIYPVQGLKNLKNTQVLYKYLKRLSYKISEKFGIWSDVGGALNRWISGFKIVQTDIKRSGMIMILGILILLIYSFSSVKIIPVLFLPLLSGLFYTLGIIPLLVGDLNIITSFFLVVSFGLGIDFAIHLTKRFQKEIQNREPKEAVVITFLSTGKSVILSALTTSLAFFIMAFSSFKGISDFGIVGGTAIIIILITMILSMPSILILGFRLRLIEKPTEKSKYRKALISDALLFVIMIALLLFCLPYVKEGVSFDYDFSKMGPTVTESKKLKNIQENIFSISMPPAAFFVARDLKSLDSFLDRINDYLEKNNDSRIGWVSSVRDIFPSEKEAVKRVKKIHDIKSLFKAKWIQYIEEADKKKWVSDFRKWNIPDNRMEFNEIPGFYLQPAMTSEGSEEFLIGVYTRFNRVDGRNAIGFTNEIYNLNLPDGIEGPFGETPVVAEIIQLVIDEGPWIFFSTFIGIFFITLLIQRSIKQTLVIMIPLMMGMYLFVGVAGILGLKINFYNIVVFPALLGMGVDDGIHYFRRFRESGNKTTETRNALFGILTLTTFTTVLGYAGLMFARHPGLFSIGLLASVGLICIWFTSLFLFPILLRFIYERR